MEKNSSTVLLISSLLIGIVLGYVFGSSEVSKQNQNAHMMPDGIMMNNDHAHSAMDDAMHDMTIALEGKTGVEFDKEFLKQMIVHHEGAVEMSEMLLVQSQNETLRNFAKTIISVQNNEIKMMQNWLNNSSQDQEPKDDKVACTMDAKICPDGSAVGRQGPNCEFAKCPGE